MRFNWILFFFLSLLCKHALGQDSLISDPRFSYKIGGGFMITHSPIMEYVSEQHFVKHELTYEKRLIGNKAWHSRYAFPYAGASLVYFNFAKDEFFGKGVSLSPYYSFFLLEKEKWSLKLRTTVGVGYIQRQFDLEDNYKNVAIGSEINLFFGILGELEWNPVQNWGLSLGANFSHFSNTAFKMPNLGINLPSLDLGIVHQFGEQKKPVKKAIPEENLDKDNYLQFRGAIGINETYPVEGPKFVATAMSVEWEKKSSLKTSFGFGLDLYNNPAQKTKLANDSIFIESTFENMHIGVSFRQIFQFGKFSTGIRAGYYFKNEDEELTNFYQEVFGIHKVWGPFSAFISLKTHFAKAEYLLMGVQYSLK